MHVRSSGCWDVVQARRTTARLLAHGQEQPRQQEQQEAARRPTRAARRSAAIRARVCRFLRFPRRNPLKMAVLGPKFSPPAARFLGGRCARRAGGDPPGLAPPSPPKRWSTPRAKSVNDRLQRVVTCHGRNTIATHQYLGFNAISSTHVTYHQQLSLWAGRLGMQESV